MIFVIKMTRTHHNKEQKTQKTTLAEKRTRFPAG